MTSTTRFSNGKTSSSVESNEAKAARLKREIVSLEARRDQITEELEAKYNEYDALMPPFEVGDIAKNARGNRVEVLAIDRSFDDWVVQVKFLDKGKAIEPDRTYIYMAYDLEAAK
jgi:hypothetical protein